MYRLWVLSLCLIAAGCSKDPLSDRVDELEKQVSELKTERAADQQALLARLDQVAVTPENAAEVADLRAKLAQTGVTASDLTQLQSRVQRLEQQIVDWTTPVVLVRRLDICTAAELARQLEE